VERAILLTSSTRIDRGDLPSFRSAETVATTYRLPPGGIDLEALDRDLVAQALERTDGNQTRAAALLGINRDQIRYRIEKYGLVIPGRRFTPTPFPTVQPPDEPERESEPGPAGRRRPGPP
jgi:two-component system NtrC family response regulator